MGTYNIVLDLNSRFSIRSHIGLSLYSQSKKAETSDWEILTTRTARQYKTCLMNTWNNKSNINGKMVAFCVCKGFFFAKIIFGIYNFLLTDHLTD